MTIGPAPMIRIEEMSVRLGMSLGDIWARVPIPKFASPCGTLLCELRNQRDTSKLMTLVWFLGFEVPMRARCTLVGTSNPPHWPKAQKKGALFARPSGGAEAASPRAGALKPRIRGGGGAAKK